MGNDYKRIHSLLIKSVISIMGSLVTRSAFASQTFGSTMPWDSVLTKIQGALTGSTAHVTIIIAIALSGLGFALGEHGSLFRKAMGIIVGGSIAVGATSFAATMGLSGAVI